MMRTPTNIFIFLYILVAILLFLYSFTQVDLGLTLTRLSIWTDIQRGFQSIGYFQRPLSTYLYLGLVVLLFAYYGFFLYLTSKNRLTHRTFWIVLFSVTAFLTFSYNAFSHDLFNYIFDAKILSFYHLNPYEYKALDFPEDPMLGFMHWTHRTYPYGPVWLAITAPLYLLGFSYLLTSIVLFKLLMAGCFLGSVYYVGEILKKTSPKHALLGMAFLGFNPLLQIESLVSAHNDIVMMFFAVIAVYFLVEKRRTLSLLFMVFSIGTKFATAVLLPVYFYQWFFMQRKKSMPWERFFLISIVFLFGAVIAASLRTNFQPWYLIYPLVFAGLQSRRYYVFIPSVIFSFFALLQYVPYLYLGNWDEPVPTILFALNVAAVTTATAITGIYWIITKKRHSV